MSRLLGASELLGASGVACLLLAAWIGLRSGAAAPSTEATHRPIPAPRVVVLPLIDLDRSADRYFADGVTDELAAGIAIVEGLELRGRASAGAFTDVNRDAAEIGARLGGAAVLDGTVRRSGGRLRLNVRLVDAASGTALWSMSADTITAALFELRDEVVRGVASTLGLDIRDRSLRRLERRRTSPEALDLYMLGRFRWAAGARGDLAEAVSYYHLAIAADSGYATAWIALADAYATLPRFTRFPPESARRHGAAAARTALQLDPDAAGAHAALGEILYLYERDWQGARSHLERARDLDPGDAGPRERLCELWLMLGDLEAAESDCAAARARDPFAFRPEWTGAGIDRVAGRPGAALARLDSLARVHPDFEPLAADLAIARLVAGDTTAAVKADLERWFGLLGPTTLADSLAAPLAVAWRAGASGPTAEVRGALARIEADLGPAPSHMVALLALFGDRDRAAEAAAAALSERMPGALRFGVFPEYAPLRELAVIRRMLSEAGLLR